MDRNELSRRLKKLRKAHGLSQQQMSDAMGLGGAYVIAKIEGGGRGVSATEFIKWCEVCGTTPDAVSRGDDITVPLVDAPEEVA